ncbi:MAG: hypothetical protein H0T60_13515, partial [Acidobacteria bacterium]|nr:hypothetical protein [Acidobacteriota bacterium]
YSPDAWKWTQRREKAGDFPDREIIVKEMFDPPAREGAALTGWTVMVKDKKGSWDGWYWSYHAPGGKPSAQPQIDYPDSGFGLYCIRCHASAESESTFASKKNVENDPISFVIQDPTMSPQPRRNKDFHEQVAEASELGDTLPDPLPAPDPNFVRLYGNIPTSPFKDLLSIPGEALDHVYPAAKGPEQFVTSDQCVSCHAASNENMSYMFEDPKRKPVNLSPYTEWRNSMMGLAGRDPIFHAQLESETTRYPKQTAFLENTCYKCHGVMGQRQIHLDLKKDFKHDMVYALPGEPDGKYGSLARDGVSCAACHHMAKEGLGTPASFTGSFNVDPPDTINGPYEEVAPLAMKNALGMTPRYAEQIKSSAMCGSCHTVVLPVFKRNGEPVMEHGKPKEIYEQTTYPEWLNSVYQNEVSPFDPKTVRTCQDCHMPDSYNGRKLRYRIANIEDILYPYVDYRAPDKEITLRVRDEYSRHTLIGINVFGMQMFQQFPDTLGIRKTDYMYSAGESGLITAQQSSVTLAREESAKVEVTSIKKTAEHLEANVRVENLTGHSFPTGVEFRRAFIHFEVLDAAGRTLWQSGRTNSVGAILGGGAGEDVLPTEFLDVVCLNGQDSPRCRELCRERLDPKVCKQLWQPHFETITREDQVQIYEELVKDPEGLITTSFIALDEPVKDNRILPKGWKPDGPYAKVSGPEFEAASDPDFIDPNYSKLSNPPGASGADNVVYRVPLSARTRGAASVRVTLYYQSIPPYYLKQRFTRADGPATKRLGYFTSHLNVKGTPIEGWKLLVRCAARGLGEGGSRACP